MLLIMLKWDSLIERAHAAGFTVELVEYCESADSPGLLGAAMGVCVHRKKIIRIRERLNAADRCFVLAHELEHAEAGPDRATNIAIDDRFYAEQHEMVEAISDRLYAL
jgi:Zn-dependent peptidase ImmA (M78 family)